MTEKKPNSFSLNAFCLSPYWLMKERTIVLIETFCQLSLKRNVQFSKNKPENIK